MQRDELGANWSWFYPYHYAPLVSDLAKMNCEGLRLDKQKSKAALASGPVSPFLQLLTVLPMSSIPVCVMHCVRTTVESCCRQQNQRFMAAKPVV